MFAKVRLPGLFRPSPWGRWWRRHPRFAHLALVREPPSSYWTIPREYADLLERFMDGKLETSSEDPSLEDFDAGFREQRRAFWSQTRAWAKQRLGKLGKDCPQAERRTAKLHESLWVEELSVAVELHRCEVLTGTLPPLGDGLFRLDISEIHDRDPALVQSLLKGVVVTIHAQDQSFNASVQPGSDSGRLILSAKPELAHAEGPYKVRFKPHRFTQTAMHRALESRRARQVLGEDPGEEATNVAPDAQHATAAERSLPSALNSVQRRALAAAMTSISRLPVVIWGPPGTGKSTLAAYLIWQLAQLPNKQVLAAAPSNTGADVLCAKLAKLGMDPSRMLRLNALGRNQATVPEEVREFCFTAARSDGHRGFAVPPLDQLQAYRVIICTCTCAAHIANVANRAGVSGWFSHVLVDEAGEATEPETLVPLQLVKDTGQVFLLGDHFQLGPLVLSSLAVRLGKLDESMIERLANERFRAAQSGILGRGWGLSVNALQILTTLVVLVVSTIAPVVATAYWVPMYTMEDTFFLSVNCMSANLRYPGLVLMKMGSASRAVALTLLFLPLVAEADVNGTALSTTADELTVKQANLRQQVKARLREADVNGTALAAADENPVKQAILRQLAKVQVDENIESDQVCWVSRHSLWDCGLECYASSSHEWRPCASKCAKLQHLGAHCNYCLAELVHCVLLQCVSPCAVSTHSSSCEGCILGGCNAKCWNP
ncbi:Mov10l1 [Symbiodinium sp. CCMP2592]|nr:Mov10l1 [Symbiodinium sp. CCMP2592]